ncbi:MAG: hypothetical protein U0871_25555 [Gemmataceae bacterium]
MSVRQRRSDGVILKVSLGGGWHAYAWTMPEVDFAFFDLKARTDPPVEQIVTHRIAFRVGVHKAAWTTGRWLRVGRWPIPARLAAPVPTYIQDPIDGSFSIYLAGHIRPARRDECVGLECCAVWDPEHVEDRLRDHFAGVPSKWVESVRIK